MEASCSTPAMGECVEMLIAHKTSVVLVINILIVIVKIGMTKSIIQQCFCVLWLFKSVSLHFLWVPELLNFILRFSLALNRQETWKNSYWSILNKAKQVRFFFFCCLGNLWWGGQRKLVGYVLLGEKRVEEDLDFILIDRVLICYSFNLTHNSLFTPINN